MNADPMSAAELHANDPSAKALGIELVEAKPGWVVVRMTVTEAMLNPRGTCHGGITFQLADTAMAYVSNAAGPTAMATAATIDFVGPAHVGDVLTAAISTTLDARNALHDAVVTNGDSIIAHFRGKTLRLKPAAPSDGSTT